MHIVCNDDLVKTEGYSLPQSKHDAIRQIAGYLRLPGGRSRIVNEVLEAWLVKNFGPQWDNPAVLDASLAKWKEERSA